MKFILNLFLATLFSLNLYSQTQGIDFTYQGWSGLTGKQNLSLYIAREGFKLGSAFNDQNYPIWFVENQGITINEGVVNYRVAGVNLDSLQKYQGQLFLYVSINGTPHDTIMIDPVPYSAYSIRANSANEAERSSIAGYASRSRVSDTSGYSVRSGNSVYSDSSSYSRHSSMSDTSEHSMHAVKSDTASFSHYADSARISAETHRVLRGGVDLQSISAQGSSNGSVLTSDGVGLVWTPSTRLQGRVQLTLVPLQSVDSDVRTLIYRVAQDIASPLPPGVEGRVITIVNSSTANFIQLQATVYNIWGGDLYINPRNSATLLYNNGQWVVIAQ